MSSYTIMPEGSDWIDCEHTGGDEQTIYSLNAHWYYPSTKIAIRNNDTGTVRIFSREQDADGNLIRVIEHK